MKSDHNQNFWYFQNNHIKTTNIFSVRSSPDSPIFKKLQSDPVVIRPKLASVLIQSDPVLVRAHLCPVLSLLGILSLDWKFWPFLGIWGFFRDFWKSMKMWKNELLQVILQIIFGSVLTIYQGTPILCCTTDTCKNHKITKMAKTT